MSTEGDPKEPSEFDRMSLNSLKRELDVQKSKTELAREEARERIREGVKPRGVPWAAVLGILVVGAAGTAGGIYYFRAQLAASGFTLPEFILPDLPDAGPFELPEIATPVVPDAGPARVEQGRAPTPRRRRDAGRARNVLDLGDTNDPIEGI